MDAEQKLTGKESDLFFGLKVIGLLFLVVASVGNFVATLSIDSFDHWFTVDLPGKPLPGLTLIVLHCSSFLGWLSFIWPLMGLAVLFIRERIRLAMVLLAAVVLVTMLQSAVIALALYLPTVTLPVGRLTAKARKRARMGYAGRSGPVAGDEMRGRWVTPVHQPG